MVIEFVRCQEAVTVFTSLSFSFSFQENAVFVTPPECDANMGLEPCVQGHTKVRISLSYVNWTSSDHFTERQLDLICNKTQSLRSDCDLQGPLSCHTWSFCQYLSLSKLTMSVTLTVQRWK